MSVDQQLRESFRRSGTNLERAKRHNHSVVVDLIRTSGHISRADLARVTSLSRQTIQNIVAELEQSNLVTLSASKISGRGHPGMDVQINVDYAYSAGVHIDNRGLKAVVCNLKGDVVWAQDIVPADHSGESIVRAIGDLISQFKSQRQDIAEKLIGIGLAAPGPFASLNDVEQIANYASLGSSTRLENLSNELEVPFVLENDASAAAIGEYYYGLGKKCRSFVFLQFGLGLGAGLMIDGKLHKGSALNSGEIGHIVVQEGGHKCSCGKRGCLEQYLSIAAFCRDLGVKNDADLAEILSNPNAELNEWFKQAGRNMRSLVNLLEAIIDPDLILVGGTAPKQILQRILDETLPLLPPLFSKKADKSRIALGTAGPNNVALGAAATSIESHFAPSVAQLLL